jgi:dTDP-L-rhamnose 4-epimerase
VYAATKLAQEHLSAAWARETGSAVVALRYHNVYGPGMPRDTPYAGVAAIFRSSLERGEPATVFEDGGQRRDFVHAFDVAQANVAAVAHLATRAPTGLRPYNVASGEPRTVGEMAAALTDALAGPARSLATASGPVTSATSSPRRGGPPTSSASPRPYRSRRV